MSWSRETSNGVFSRVNSCFNGRKGKVFCIVSWLAMKSGYSMISLSVENRGVSPAIHQHQQSAKPNIHGSKLLLCIWYLGGRIGSAGCSLLWAAQTERNYHGRSLSTTIDAFEPSIEGKTAAIRAKTRQSDFAIWQRSATCCKTGENLLGNA